MRQSWSKAKVIATIRQLHEAGEKINSNRAQLHHHPLYLAACNYIGSWPKAIRAAGFRYKDIRITERKPWKWSKDAVIAGIKTLHQTEGKLNSNHVQRHHHQLYGAALRFFGSWGGAVEAADFSYDLVRVRELRSWNKAKVVKAVVFRKSQGKSLVGSIVDEEDRGLYQAARRYFGRSGWRKALRLAGIDPRTADSRVVWSKTRVVEEILLLHGNGTPLYSYYLMKHGREALHSIGCKLFGSWKKAIRAAGLDYSKVRASRHKWWNKKRICAEIKRLEKRGVRLSSKSVQHLRGDLSAAAIVCFGSWGAAVEAAGINYRAHLLVWSHKTWLRNLPKARARALRASTRKLALERRKHA